MTVLQRKRMKCNVIVAVALSMACAAPAFGEAAAGPAPPTHYKLADVAMTLERTSCFGPCPVYSLRLEGRGRVAFHGTRFVESLGDQHGEIVAGDIMRLLNQFYHVRFFDLLDSYHVVREVHLVDGDSVEVWVGQIVDVPCVIVSLRIGNYSKSVVAEYGAPPELLALADSMDAVAGTKRWIGDGASQRPKGE